MGTTRNPESLRWEAQRLLIGTDNVQKHRKQHLERAAALAGQAGLIERAALNEAAPKDKSAQSDSSPNQRMLRRAGLETRSYVPGPESTSLLASAARLFLPRSARGWARAIVFIPLAVLTGGAWVVTAYQAQNMNAPMMSANMEMHGSFMGGAVAFLAIWSTMMAAMMLPSVAPMLLTFAALEGRRRDKKPLVSTWTFGAGYLFVWAVIGVAVYLLLWASSALVSDFAPAYREPIACLTLALVLIEAGLYQFTPLKRVFLTQCRTPVSFFLWHWREGALGPFRMGLRHGAYCLGCCWALFAVLLTAGVMSLPWTLALTLIVFVEKVLPQGQRIAIGVGAASLLAGALIAVLDLT
jgi:predicted metal-binding membrane protein